MLRVKYSSQAVLGRIKKLKDTLVHEGDRVASQTLSATRKEIKKYTAVRYTGETRRGWVTVREKMGKYATVNQTNAAMFLEEGTRAHGPVVKKALFIPLNKKAFFWYRYGKFKLQKKTDYITVKFVKGIRPRKMAERRIPFALRYGIAKFKQLVLSKI